jgi:hypothetical protein
MSDPFLVLGRILMLIFVPVMLVVPLVFAALVPNRAVDDSARIKARGLMTVLALSTAVLLAVWLGLVLVGRGLSGGMIIAGFWWPWFFPLWFGFAMPLIRAKNPGWGLAKQEALGGSGAVRTASLVNRERESPVTRAMWAMAVVANLAGIAAIAARGLMPFPMESSGAGDEAAAAAQRLQWQLFLGLSCLGPIGLLWLPKMLRAMRTEPEPMDAAGSRELADLYAAQRRRRVLGMFWINGVAGPLAIAGTFALAVWFPDLGGWWGVVGGVGGSVVGIGGGIFGVRMSAERAKIAEVRTRLEQSRAASGA